MNLESKRPAGPLFRVGRDDDAWAVPDWAYAKEDRNLRQSFRRSDGCVQGSLCVFATAGMLH